MKVCVIGAGPAGYSAAIRSAQLGAEVHLIEEGCLGGACLNYGCIPLKLLLAEERLLCRLKRSVFIRGRWSVSPDWKEKKEKLLLGLRSGLEGILKSYTNIRLVRGRARFLSPERVEISQEGKTAISKAERFVIATGCRDKKGPFLADKRIKDYNSFLNMRKIPKKLAIAGGGVSGVEFASLFGGIGRKVVIFEKQNRLLPALDPEVSSAAKRSLLRNGVKVFISATIQKSSSSGDGIKLVYKTPEGTQEDVFDCLLNALEREPVVEGLGLEKLGVMFDSAGIRVNSRMQTNIRNIYAAGDVTGKFLFANVAAEEGIIAARNALGQQAEVSYDFIPQAIFLNPEIAFCGMLESEAKKKRIEYEMGYFPLKASGKAVVLGEYEGFIKILIEKNDKRILGGMIVGPYASELISLLALAVRKREKASALQENIFVHPTISEGIKESIRSVDNSATGLPYGFSI